ADEWLRRASRGFRDQISDEPGAPRIERRRAQTRDRDQADDPGPTGRSLTRPARETFRRDEGLVGPQKDERIELLSRPPLSEHWVLGLAIIERASVFYGTHPHPPCFAWSPLPVPVGWRPRPAGPYLFHRVLDGPVAAVNRSRWNGYADRGRQ